MSRYQIVEKLDSFLKGGFIDSEPKAMYLMVETRKILDHAYEKKTDYLLLRFFSDWVVHTEKTYNLEHIAPVIQKIYDAVKITIETPYPSTANLPIVDFLYMEDLREEMLDLFRKEGLPLDFFEKGSWVSFVAQLVQILTDQPIVNPIPEVPLFVLTPANPGCVCGIMRFSTPISTYDGKNEYSYFDFKNVY